MPSYENYKRMKITKYGLGQKPVLTQSARNGGLRDSVFTHKDDPNYRPSYGHTYTERQRKIVNEELPLPEIRFNEITTIMKKAISLGDVPTYEKAKALRDLKIHENDSEYSFSFSPEEAKAFLESITPWKINWEKQK